MDKNLEKIIIEAFECGAKWNKQKGHYLNALDFIEENKEQLNLYGVGNSLPSKEECNCEIIKEIKKQTKRIIEFNTEVQDLKFSFNGHKLTGLIQK